MLEPVWHVLLAQPGLRFEDTRVRHTSKLTVIEARAHQRAAEILQRGGDLEEVVRAAAALKTTFFAHHCTLRISRRTHGSAQRAVCVVFGFERKAGEDPCTMRVRGEKKNVLYQEGLSK